LSESVAKARIVPERRKRTVDILRFFSQLIPARGAFATDSDTIPPQITPGAPRVPRHHVFHHKASYTATVKFGYIVMSVVSVRPQSEEQCLFWKTERATIGEHKTDVRLGIA